MMNQNLRSTLLLILVSILSITPLVLYFTKLIPYTALYLISGIFIWGLIIMLVTTVIYLSYKKPKQIFFQRHIDLIINILVGLFVTIIWTYLFQTDYATVSKLLIIVIMGLIFFVIIKLNQRKRRTNNKAIFKEIISDVSYVIFPAIIVTAVTMGVSKPMTDSLFIAAAMIIGVPFYFLMKNLKLL